MPRPRKTEWVGAQEATRILSAKAGRPIVRNYISNLARGGKVRFREVDGRTQEYLRADVEDYVVKSHKKKTAQEAENSTDAA
jgi:hypothetical protein